MLNAAYLTYLATLISLFVILGLSFNLLAGFTGLTNLGQTGFFLVGAYTVALLQLNFGLPYTLAMPAALLAGALIAIFFSLLTKRTRGDTVAVMGLWFMIVLVIVALNWSGLTHGALGIPGIRRPLGFASPQMFLIFSALITLVVYGILYRILRSPYGRVLGSVRDDELAAQTLGKNIFKARVIAFAISGGVSGIGGGLFAYTFQFIDPGSFHISMLVAVLALVYVGGLASLPGVIVGTLLIIILPEFLRFLPFNPEVLGALRQIVFSTLVLLVILWKPRGILGKVEL
ncbi:branched-chain amino acid ABC transporter permease [Candidatus Uhrbacteria bacterium]|nr:branched-chain amino acid ABC transporter permease [Candidatus Uhrbacteria bacterium]